jgi:hypothetical protein
MWSDEQMEQWHLKRKAYLEDRVSVAHDNAVDQRRRQVQGEMIQLLNSFLDGSISFKKFNAIFQQKTHGEWSVFHLRGMSGGLFLNKLVKHVPSEDTFAHLLRLMIRVPENTQSGRRQMQAFVQFLEGLIASRQITRVQLQPARVPFFLSVWWHIQNPEQWPIFYFDVREALLIKETRSKESLAPVEAYFAFRTHFLTLTQMLDVSSWELEHLASWWTRRNVEVHDVGNAQPSVDVSNDNHHVPPQKQVCILASRMEAKDGIEALSGARDKKSASTKDERMVSCRTHLQWLLAKLGHKVGCQVWIATKDHNKACQHERLGNLSLSSLPVLAETAYQQIICQIDVLWLLDNDIIAAYEIEQAYTDVSTSLLRLYDLGALFPSREMHLCVVAPQDRFEKVQLELGRPTFREHEQHKRCVLISEEFLLQHEAHMLRWATSPAVIQELISQRDGRGLEKSCSTEYANLDRKDLMIVR